MFDHALLLITHFSHFTTRRNTDEIVEHLVVRLRTLLIDLQEAIEEILECRVTVLNEPTRVEYCFTVDCVDSLFVFHE